MKRLNWILFLLIFIWCLGILWELIINIFPNAIYAFPILKNNYSIVCHTQSEKLFTYLNYRTLTCSRCTGIYFGSLVSIFLIIVGLRKNISTKFLLVISLPMFVDVILTTFNFYEYSQFLALFSGLLLGSSGFFYIHTSIVELLLENKGKS